MTSTQTIHQGLVGSKHLARQVNSRCIGSIGPASYSRLTTYFVQYDTANPFCGTVLSVISVYR